MKLLVVLLYLISFEVNANHSEVDLPTAWDIAPSSIDDYPLSDNCSLSSTRRNVSCRIIDPWSYLNRLGMYKILISATSPPMPFCSTSNASNILFGLASQFGWQFDSNRLFSNGTYQVSNSSWWASANYYLSVIPFLAAVDAGLIRASSFKILQRENFCSDSLQCLHQVPEAMMKWRMFFSNISQPNYCTSSTITDKIIDHCYLGPMWSAHVASIEGALPLIESKVKLLPSVNEQRFGIGWAHLVGFIGMARESTNLYNTNRYQHELLPNRLLRADDHPPHCADLPATVNQALELLFLFRDAWYSDLIPMWKRATCNYEARVYAQKVLETVVISKAKAIEYYSEAVLQSYRFKCDE